MLDVLRYIKPSASETNMSSYFAFIYSSAQKDFPSCDFSLNMDRIAKCLIRFIILNLDLEKKSTW